MENLKKRDVIELIKRHSVKGGTTRGGAVFSVDGRNGVVTLDDLYAAIDDKDDGKCQTMNRIRMSSTDKDGIEITIPVKSDDIEIFRKYLIWI